MNEEVKNENVVAEENSSLENSKAKNFLDVNEINPKYYNVYCRNLQEEERRKAVGVHLYFHSNRGHLLNTMKVGKHK